MSMRRDPEAVARYREILAQHGVDVTSESDEQVIERMDRTMEAFLTMSRRVGDTLQTMAVSVGRAARRMVDLYVQLGGAVLAEESAMDLKLRDEVGLDVRLLELHDEPGES